MSTAARTLGSPSGYEHHDTTRLAEFFAALAAVKDSTYTRAERIPLDQLDQWRADPRSGIIRHVSGKFFTVQGIDVTISTGDGTRRWSQPIIVQPEIGILGVLVKRFDGVPHYLMQLKAEPGNVNDIQVSPTVQATRSNYTRVHGGHSVPYLDYFRRRDRHRVISDVRQSEQGSWFLRKRNRNMIVEAVGDVAVLDGFHWLTIQQIHDLLRMDDLVNMDARSVLSCLPFYDLMPAAAGLDRAEPAASLIRSWSGTRQGRHDMAELLSWITDTRTHTDIEVHDTPLRGLRGWRYGTAAIAHESGRFFEVIGVRVEARGREVGGWDQPMVAARNVGLSGFLVAHFDGVLHVLAGMQVKPGFADIAELAPTVQCTPANYDHGDLARPPFLDTLLGAEPDRVLYDTTLSEEGGRFFETRNRYMIVEVDRKIAHSGFRWMTLHQLTELVRHSHYVSVEARTLLACMATLATTREAGIGAAPAPSAGDGVGP